MNVERGSQLRACYTPLRFSCNNNDDTALLLLFHDTQRIVANTMAHDGLQEVKKKGISHSKLYVTVLNR